MRWVPVLVAIAACADAGESPITDGPMQVNVDGVGVHVIGPRYAMDFANTGVRMPAHLAIQGATGGDVLGIDAACNRESLIGVAVFPPVIAAAGDRGGATRSTIEVELMGTVVVKTHVHYEVDYGCKGAQTLSG